MAVVTAAVFRAAQVMKAALLAMANGGVVEKEATEMVADSAAVMMVAMKGTGATEATMAAVTMEVKRVMEAAWVEEVA